MSGITYDIMKQRQDLPLDLKIVLSQQRIRSFYSHYNGDVYISYSGGKDSTVLVDLVKEMYPDVPAVFCDTGLEYPEVRKLALKKSDVVLKPKMNFKKVIQNYGYPVIGKKQARMIHDLKHETESNKRVCELYRTGITSSGKKASGFKLADKWMYLVEAPFEVSEKCCDVMKKEPFKRYEKETSRHPFIGTMASESKIREQQYIKYGCNAFDLKRPHSTPMGFWNENDVLEYIKTKGIEYAQCYGEIVETENGYATTGEHRTGCMFCMFGVQYDGVPNRFQRMQSAYPKQYKYCIDTLGIGKVLDYIGIPYKYHGTLFDLRDDCSSD